MEQKVRIFALMIIILCLAGPVSAEYTVTEILFIPWGDGPNELAITEEHREYNECDPIDTVGYLVGGDGPEKMFVDQKENIYFTSNSLAYLKGFDKNGDVIVDYSTGKTKFNYDFFCGWFYGVYVDSLGRIYCNGNELACMSVAVVDRNNNLLERLNPLGYDTDLPASVEYRGSDDVILFKSWVYGFSTYMNGQFYPGGSYGWRARDGYYYHVETRDSSSFRFIRLANPDTSGRPETADTTIVPYPPGGLKLAFSMGVDDDLRLYVQFLDTSRDMWKVRVYDENYDFLYEILPLPSEENRYKLYTADLFFRQDGNVYEFHCRDDGMHVFRWSKK